MWAADKDVWNVFICSTFQTSSALLALGVAYVVSSVRALRAPSTLWKSAWLFQSPPLDTVSLQKALTSAQGPLDRHIEDTENRCGVQEPMEKRRHWFHKEQNRFKRNLGHPGDDLCPPHFDLELTCGTTMPLPTPTLSKHSESRWLGTEAQMWGLTSG